MKSWKVLLAAMLMGLVVLSSGCAGENQGGGNQSKEQNQTEGKESNNQTWDAKQIVTMAWEQSGHTQVHANPAGRDECISCHLGNGFAKEGAKAADLKTKDPINCDACHSDRGKKLMTDGRVTVDAGEIEADKGSVCAFCHNTRHAADPKDPERSGPHYGAQGNLIAAVGGMEFEGFEYKNDAHGKNGNCVNCHMGKESAGPANHTMSVGVNACKGCHAKLESFNPVVSADYSGDGTVGGIRDEVKDLMGKLQDAIAAKTGAVRVEYKKGKVVLFDKTGKPIEKFDDNVYAAAYNYLVIKQDGTYGVHNPWYAVQLLQSSVKAVTGKEIPNAKKYGQS